MVFFPLRFLTPFDLLDLFVPVFMDYLRSIKMVFPCDLSFLWWVLPNKRLPVGYYLCFNLCWSTLAVSVLKILFLFPKLSETSVQLICLCAPLMFVLFIQTFLLKKLLKFVVMSCSVVLFPNLPFQKVFSNILLILLPPLSSLVSITSCTGRLMVWRWGQVWVPRWQIFLLGSASLICLILFTNPSAWAGYDTRSIFKRSLTGLNSEFSFS